MYSRCFFNRIVKMKLSSVQIESIRRCRHICSNKYFSTLVRQAEAFRMAKSLNESHVVSRILYREYMKNTPTESLIQKSPEEATHSRTNDKNQNLDKAFDKKATALCLKWCDEQSNGLNIGNSSETITIIADKSEFCRAICFLSDAPVTANISFANSSSSKTFALRKPSTKSEVSSSPSQKATQSSEKSSPSSEKVSSTEIASLPSGKALTTSEKALTTSETLTTSEKVMTTSEKVMTTSEKAVAQKTSKPSANSNFRERQGKRLIDKLTDEEIEEICRTKCPCRRCEALPIKSSSKYPFGSPSGSYSSFYSGVRERSDIPGFDKQRMPKMRKLRRMRDEGQDQPIRKMISPKNFPNYPQFNGNSGQRIIHPNQKIGNLVPDFKFDVHPRPVTPQEGPRIPLKSKYERKIRSYEKLRGAPVVFRPKIGDIHPNRNNSGNNLGYVRIPQMPSNDPLIQNKQRRNQSIPEHKNINQQSTALPNNPQGLPSRNNLTSNMHQRNPLQITSIPIDQKNWNISKSNQIKSDVDAKSNTTSGKKLVDLDENVFRLTENPSVMVYGPGKLKLVNSQYPQMRNEKDIIIQMEFVNLTDADARHYLTGKDNPYSFGTAIAGRTGSGTVIEIGSDVHNVKPGDKVLIKPISCGKCLLCLSDRSSLCENVAKSQSSHNGTLSHYYVHSSEFVTKISNSIKPTNGNVSSIGIYLKNAATTATLSSAIRACQKAKVTAGDNVMVIDGGPLGTATALTAQSMGATSVCLADIRKSILEQALKLGIDHVFLIDPRSPFRNTAIKIWEHIGDYPRLIFDCTGSQLTNQIAICAAKTGGKAILMKNDGNESTVSIANAILRDVDIIISTIGSDESEHAAIQYLNAGRFLINNDLYHHYDLSTVREAFQHLLDPNRLKSHIIVECRMNNDTQKKEKKNDDETKQ